MEPSAPDRLRFLCPTRYHSFPNYFSNRGLLSLIRFPVRFDRAFTSYFSERSQPIDGVTSLAGCASCLPAYYRSEASLHSWLGSEWPRPKRGNPRYTKPLATGLPHDLGRSFIVVSCSTKLASSRAQSPEILHEGKMTIGN